MEEKINIAEILKDKSKGIRLYSPIFGECAFCLVREETDDICVKKHDGEIVFFDSKGLYNNLGEVMLFPSREMRDWSKFAWKKGDILVNKDAEVHIIFDGFEDDTYKNFHGQYYLWEEGGSMVSFEEDENYMQTSDFNKANKEDAQEYIHKIEKILGGKLNRETLEVEKAQPEFKDGDIAFADFGNTQDVFIVSGKTNLSEGYYSFIALNLNSTKALSIGCKTSFFKKNLNTLRLATEEEKQQLFDALAEEGKAWDVEKKMIVDLKQKVELKPFDKVLVRHQKTEEWSANIFSHIDKTDEYLDYICVNGRWEFCIPYIGNEHLLGTTKDVEG